MAATLADIGLAAAINILSAIAFLIAFAFLRLQPINDRVYFPKWYLKGVRNSPSGGNIVSKFVNLDMRSYVRFLGWMPAALKMPEKELIEHAGLDSAVFLRIYLIGYIFFYNCVVFLLLFHSTSLSLHKCHFPSISIIVFCVCMQIYFLCIFC
jgi:calcium permeable stress-gated cation channel